MRRRELSNEELGEVIKLRQAGTSWLKIQHKTGIHRRTAKRAYDKWERSQSLPELKEARKAIAAAEFRKHMHSLITLATSFVRNLDVPHLPDMMMKNGEEFSSWLLDQDLLQRGVYISSETKEPYKPPLVDMYTMEDTQPFWMGDPQSYRREKELLFESLKVHTRENVRWKSWDEWKEARDNCVRVRDKLQEETSEVVNNFLKQERETNFLQRVKQGSREDDPAKQMAEVVLREIWRAILRGKLEEEVPWFRTISDGREPYLDISVKSRDETVLRFTSDTDKNLAEKVKRICNLAAENLRRGEIVKSLKDEVRTIKKVADELREMLNPVRLIPMILSTRCELCPA